MGFACTWCAVREEHADAVLAQLGLSPTGKTQDVPEALISTARLTTGWRVIWYNEYGCPFLTPESLAELSQHREVILCMIEEHVMASSSELWASGRRQWWISHEGEHGPKGLESGGFLPESFASIREELYEAQRAEGGDDADVDYIFDIPPKVAQSVTGFKHDENWPLAGEKFVVLAGQSPPKKGFWSRFRK
jgi:hypothetical protein